MWKHSKAEIGVCVRFKTVGRFYPLNTFRNVGICLFGAKECTYFKPHLFRYVYVALSFLHQMCHSVPNKVHCGILMRNDPNCVNVCQNGCLGL